MIHITTTLSQKDSVLEIIEQVPRLSELVTVDLEGPELKYQQPLKVDDRRIVIPLSWDSAVPPFLLPNIVPIQSDTLLGVIFGFLGNLERTQHYLAEFPELNAEFTAYHYFQQNWVLPQEIVQALETNSSQENPYRYNHNIALLQQYGVWPQSVTLPEVQQRYQQAMATAPDGEHYAFTLKQYATLLLDTRQTQEAERLLQQQLSRNLSDEAAFALKSVLIRCWMSSLSVPYDSVKLEMLKKVLWETLSYHEREQQEAEVGLLLIDASEIANISESYSESLGYINRALDIFRQQEMPELFGSSLLRKGVLLYTWAQNGNPQFYKPAIDTYQEALKLFKREEAPDTFAQIHLHLGVLYAEMAAMQQKKNIWAAVSATSFQEALRFFTKDEYPYEYGLVCNNYANALTKYPTALRTDNYEKALEFYEEALSVRTAAYPYERALTLLNFLEASWHIDNGEDGFNQHRYDDMVSKAREVKTLVDAPDLVSEAEGQLERLSQLLITVKSEGYA